MEGGLKVFASVSKYILGRSYGTEEGIHHKITTESNYLSKSSLILIRVFYKIPELYLNILIGKRFL